MGASQASSAIVATYDYVDEDGHLLLQCVRYDPKDFRQRQHDGPGWIWNLDGVRRVLYRLPKLKSAARVFVVEGERDVHTIEKLGLIGTCNPMGAGKWRPEYAESLRGKQVVIIGDADKPGRKHAADVAQNLLGVAAEVRKLELPAGKDISDWVNQGGTLRELEELVARAEALASHGSKNSDKSAYSDLEQGAIPRTFELTDQGLFKMVIKDGETQRIYLCGKLEVLSLTRDTRGDNWGKQVRFQDPDGRIHELVISETSLASRQGEWFGQLKAGGLFVSPRNDVRGHLLSYLSEAKPTARMRTVNQVGWHEGVFVTPIWTEPAAIPEHFVLDEQSIGQHHFSQRGSLEQWRGRVSVLCRQNPVLIFVVSAAFAPVLLPLKSGLGGGFHLFATSSCGKTTVLIWSDPVKPPTNLFLALGQNS